MSPYHPLSHCVFSECLSQVCMMVAALSSAAKCFGIEMLSAPHQYALKLLHRFETELRSYKIEHAPIELLQGDFLQVTPSLREALSSAGLVFVNNPKFDPCVNLSILEKLCPMLPKKAKVICFESIIGTKGYWNDLLLYVRHRFSKSHTLTYAQVQDCFGMRFNERLLARARGQTTHARKNLTFITVCIADGYKFVDFDVEASQTCTSLASNK